MTVASATLHRRRPGRRPGRHVGRRVHVGLRLLSIGLASVVAVGGCTGGPILANPPVARPSPPATAVPTPAPSDPQPIVFPRDDGPHGRLTEWWYYTGHVRDVATGDRYGFEFVVFRAERGDFPVSWASHLAITDEGRGSFIYAQRSEVGPQVDRSPRAGGTSGGGGPAVGDPTGFSLAVDATDPLAASDTAWSMSGSGGGDRLVAGFTATEATAAGSAGGVRLDLAVRTTRPAILHDGDGWVDFGPAGGSYYYSRTRMSAAGSLVVDGRPLTVEGSAWFDHQWGDFISVGGGGWDWIAVNLADGTDVTVSLVRDASGATTLAYGTLVRPDGATVHLPASAFAVAVSGHWTSSRTGATYPAGWILSIPAEGLAIGLEPSVPDQELDTRLTTGVVYWEGSQRVAATRDGHPRGGEAYVELTGYAAAVEAAGSPPATGTPSP